MLLVSLSAVVVSCSSIKVHDKTIYADLGRAGAVQECLYTDCSRDLTKQEWDAIRFGKLCMDSDDFTEYETLVETFCTNYGCDYQTKKEIERGRNLLNYMRYKVQSFRSEK